MISVHVRTILRLLLTVQNPWVYFLNWFGIAKTGVTYRLWNGMSVSSRQHAIDGSALNEVWFDRSYDPNAFGIPFDWERAKHILDIGAHIGTFTLFATSKAPTAQIVSLEPEPTNFVMLTTNVTANTLLDRISLHPVGLGTGEAMTLYTFPEDRGGNSMYRGNEDGTPITIETISLAELLRRHKIEQCDYLKLDCEGAEYDALYALSPSDLRRFRCIGLEYHHFSEKPKHTGEALASYLQSSGFRVFRHKKAMMIAVRKQ